MSVMAISSCRHTPGLGGTLIHFHRVHAQTVAFLDRGADAAWSEQALQWAT